MRQHYLMNSQLDEMFGLSMRDQGVHPPLPK